MALGKSIDTEYGIPATYWVISTEIENFKEKWVDVEYCGYATQDAYVAGNLPLTCRRFRVSGEAYTGDLSRADLYPQMKTLPDFIGSVDV